MNQPYHLLQLQKSSLLHLVRDLSHLLLINLKIFLQQNVEYFEYRFISSNFEGIF
jgi:hypothetical protein